MVCLFPFFNCRSNFFIAQVHRFLKFELLFSKAKGQRYELGDFVIKIGQVTVGVSFKGILIEVFSFVCVRL